MNDDKLKLYIINLLKKDSDVRRVLCEEFKVVEGKGVEGIRDNDLELRKAGEHFAEEGKRLEDKYKAELTRAERLTASVKAENERLRQANAGLSADYAELDDIYRRYMTLDIGIRQGFGNVIKADNPVLFVASGINDDNLRLIWERMSVYMDKYTAEEKKILNAVFDYFFEVYNSVDLVYKRIETETGERFDDGKHSRASNSSVSGYISEVVLRGYVNVHNNKVVKSIVRM